MGKKKNQPQKQQRVEFGMEFGDINASKYYELPYANIKDTCGKKHK